MFIVILGILIIAGFFFLETRLRSGSEAKSWQAGQFDQRSTMFIVLAYVVCGAALISSSFLDKLNVAVLPRGLHGLEFSLHWQVLDYAFGQ